MKRVIRGKTYNTETATLVAFRDNGCSITNFYYCGESLYRTPRGIYFLHGKGGPMSRYTRTTDSGRSWIGGEKIIPISETEAQKWLEGDTGGYGVKEGCSCQQCGVLFTIDLNIPDFLWDKISRGKNLLCPVCIIKNIIMHHRNEYAVYHLKRG